MDRTVSVNQACHLDSTASTRTEVRILHIPYWALLIGGSPLGLTDGQGRGCIFTAPTTQWQCDVGATPMGGVSVGCDGALSYNGNNKFDSCPTGDNGGFNIYSKQPANQQGCVQISLTADACKSGCPAPPPPPPPKPVAKACPADLTGNWEVRVIT